MTIPDHIGYTREHEWLKLDGDVATVGITAYACQALGDVVYVDLPRVGDHLTSSQPCGEVESTKSISDLYSPADGEVLEINQAVADDPALVNTDPYGQGWLFKIRFLDQPDLLDADAYAAFTEGQ